MWQRNFKDKRLGFRTVSGKRYSSKQYINPYFRKKSKKTRNWSRPRISLGWKAKLVFYAFLVLVLTGLFLSFSTTFFHVKNIEVNGGGRINTDEVRRIALQQRDHKKWLILPQNYLFFYDKSELDRELHRKYAFDNLQITKKLPNTVVLDYQEKSYALVWQENGNYQYADHTGLILEDANLLEIGERDYPIIENVSQSRVMGASILSEPAYINAVLKLFQDFKNYEDMQIERFLYEGPGNTIKLKLVDGPLVFFNLSEDLDKQVNKLLVIKNEKIKDDFSSKEYIDVRYGDAVYYR